MSSPRPNRMPRDQRRTQLLEAAVPVFVGKGYHATAMDDIAEAAGVSKPVLYQHFGSKLELYLALLDDACDELRRVVDAALASTDDNAQRVVATMGAFFDFVAGTSSHATDPHTETPTSLSGGFRLIFESDLSSEAEVEQRISDVNDQIADAVAEVITADTGLAGDRAKLLAISLVGMAQVSARYWLDGPVGAASTQSAEAADATPDQPGVSPIPQVEAQRLVSTLAWRGIAGFPLVGHPPHP